MGPYVEEHILSWVLFLPLGTAVALLCTGLVSSALAGTKGLPGVLWYALAVSSSSLTFILAAAGLWVGFDPEQTGYQFVEHVAWLPDHGIHYFVGIDGISLVLVLLTTLLFPVALLSTWKEPVSSRRSFVVLVLALETALLGVFVSLNLFQFYLCWELALVPVYFIVGVWGGKNRVTAAIKFFAYTVLGSLLMFVAILVLYRLNFEQGGAWNLDLVSAPGRAGLSLLETHIPAAGGEVPWWSTQTWLFAAFALAFAIKIPLVPFHTWLPDVHVGAPTAGSALFAGVLLKMGAYGFVRFALPLFPDVASSESVVLLAFSLSLASIIGASLIAMVQRDIKRLIAYSSIAHLGFVVLGVFTLNVHGLTGSVLQMVNHGLSTAGLFLLVGFIYERRQTRNLIEFGGVAKPMPVYAALFGITLMSSLGLPALNGFVGEFLILLGAFEVRPWVGAGAAMGAVLIGIYLMWMYRKLMLGSVKNPENRGLIDLDWREKTAILALVLPILWIGIYPNSILRRIEPSVIELLRVMDERSMPAEPTTEEPVQMRASADARRVAEPWAGSQR